MGNEMDVTMHKMILIQRLQNIARLKPSFLRSSQKRKTAAVTFVDITHFIDIQTVQHKSTASQSAIRYITSRYMMAVNLFVWNDKCQEVSEKTETTIDGCACPLTAWIRGSGCDHDKRYLQGHCYSFSICLTITTEVLVIAASVVDA